MEVILIYVVKLILIYSKLLSYQRFFLSKQKHIKHKIYLIITVNSQRLTFLNNGRGSLNPKQVLAAFTPIILEFILCTSVLRINNN